MNVSGTGSMMQTHILLLVNNRVIVSISLKLIDTD